MTIKRGFRFNPFFNANGAMLEDNGRQGRDTARQWEARPPEGGHTIQHRHACGENGRKGETRPWERGHANIGTCGEMEDKGKQGGDVDTPCTKGKQKGTHGETRPREGGHTIQHRHTYVETRGDKTSGGYTITSTHMGQDLRKAGTARQWVTRPRERRTHHHRVSMGDKGRHDLGKVDTSSNTGTYVGRQRETRLWGRRHTM